MWLGIDIYYKIFTFGLYNKSIKIKIITNIKYNTRSAFRKKCSTSLLKENDKFWNRRSLLK